MPETTLDITCHEEGCGHRQTVPRELFQRYPIHWVRCSKCGTRRPGPRISAQPKSRAPLLVGIAAVVVCGAVGAVIMMNRNGKPPVVAAVSGEAEDGMAGTKRAREKAEQAKGEVEQHLTDLQPAIERFKSDLDDLTKQLNDMGIASAGDVAGNYRAELIAKEVRELIGQVRVMEKKRQSYEQAKDELESVIRRLERKTVIEQLGLTEEELQEVTDTLDTIDIKIQTAAEQDSDSALSEFEADEALNELLRGKDS
jgi:exonuclease VII small subunit